VSPAASAAAAAGSDRFIERSAFIRNEGRMPGMGMPPFFIFGRIYRQLNRSTPSGGSRADVPGIYRPRHPERTILRLSRSIGLEDDR
jgi:hypothetical protein